MTFQVIISDANEPTPFPPGRVEWRSNLEGVLGFGDTITVPLVVEGLHEVTVVATDELGVSATLAPALLNVVEPGSSQPEVVARIPVTETSRTGSTVTLRLESTGWDFDGIITNWEWRRLDTGAIVGDTLNTNDTSYTTPFTPCSTIHFRITVTDDDSNTASADTYWTDLC